MADELGEFRPSDVTFLEMLKESNYFTAFKVEVHGRLCVIKVVGPSAIPFTRFIKREFITPMHTREI